MQKIGLNQSLSVTTKLTPSQIQVIRLLELPSIELNQRINEELQDNPALEEGRDEMDVAAENFDEFKSSLQSKLQPLGFNGEIINYVGEINP